MVGERRRSLLSLADSGTRHSGDSEDDAPPRPHRRVRKPPLVRMSSLPSGETEAALVSIERILAHRRPLSQMSQLDLRDVTRALVAMIRRVRGVETMTTRRAERWFVLIDLFKHLSDDYGHQTVMHLPQQSHALVVRKGEHRILFLQVSLPDDGGCVTQTRSAPPFVSNSSSEDVELTADTTLNHVLIHLDD